MEISFVISHERSRDEARDCGDAVPKGKADPGAGQLPGGNASHQISAVAGSRDIPVHYGLNELTADVETLHKLSEL